MVQSVIMSSRSWNDFKFGTRDRHISRSIAEKVIFSLTLLITIGEMEMAISHVFDLQLHG